MQLSKTFINELKHVLEQGGLPNQLDDHAWTKSLVVNQLVASDSTLKNKSPGYQLLAGLAALFRETMPSTPPRRGKRIDTKWGQFGVLAALYFAPFEYGLTRPSTLQDAWGRIDQAIPLFVYGKPPEDVPPQELMAYQITLNEEHTTPTSTLSDWHVKGLQKLAQRFVSQEYHLSQTLKQPPLIDPTRLTMATKREANNPPPADTNTRSTSRRSGSPVRRIGLLILLLVVLLLGWKSWRIYSLTQAVLTDVSRLETLAGSPPDATTLAAAGPLLANTRADVTALRKEARPLLWLGDLAGWLPVYGGDLANAEHLLDMAAGLTIAADEGYQGGEPVLQLLWTPGADASPEALLARVTEGQPRFVAARDALEQALDARAQLEGVSLSPYASQMIAQVDGYLPLVEDGLAMAVALPKLLGGEAYGPQTYMVLLQNEDELRPTGGFITAVGSITIDKADIISFVIEDSFAVDDIEKSYPRAPLPLEDYMSAHMLLLRDANWWPDFPRVAALTENLYAYTRNHAVDGVIAIDQEAIRLLLSALGPVTVGDGQTVGADNVIDYMRSAKAPESGSALDREWWQQRKDFMRDLADGIFLKFQGESDFSWLAVGEASQQALSERHIIIQLDDPDAAAVLARRDWDGDIHLAGSDFLMVIDSNIGFNKVNAVVETGLTYRLDFSDVNNLTAALQVTHTHTRPGDVPCVHAPDYGQGSYDDLIARCYWNYLRVYTLAESELVEATPHAVPGENMLLGESVPARIDVEFLPPEGTRAFGTLMLLPMGEQLQTDFQLSLPSSVLVSDSQRGGLTYRLHVQKQPGTIAVPITLSIRLPNGATLIAADPVGEVADGVWQYQGDLREDLELTFTFSP